MFYGKNKPLLNCRKDIFPRHYRVLNENVPGKIQPYDIT
jgi:hypothetical protein